MIHGAKVAVVLLLFYLGALALPAASAATPHGDYSTATTLCQLCHQTHESPSSEANHNERTLRFEESSADITYTGLWFQKTGGSRSSSASLESSQTGAEASFTFQGSSVAWIATETSASGRAQVYLDGQLQGQVDLYNAIDRYQARVWEKSGLAKGDHTIEVRVLGAKAPASSGFDVDIDALDITVPKVMLLRGASEKAVCYTCHAGTGSIYNVAEEFGETTNTSPPVSKHPVPEGVTLCSDCHSPHATAENWDGNPEENEVVRLLRSIYSSFIGFVVSASNSWLDTPEPPNVGLGLPEQRKLTKPYEQCGSCHGAGSTLPGGDITKYYDYGGSKHDGTASVSMDSKAEIACMSCHEWHISSLPKLLETTIAGSPVTANDNQICYACHVEPKIASYDASPGDVHGVTDSTNTSGSPPGFTGPYYYRMAQIKCVVCHSPHGTQNIYWVQPGINDTSPISVDGTAPANRGQWEAFCQACHLYSHDSTSAYDICVNCHFHGAGADASATTKF